MTKRRAFLRAGAAAAALVAQPARALVAHAARALATAAPLRIGAVLPFSGGLEALGYQAKLGIDVALSGIHAAGGILGRQVELIYQDDRSDPKVAIERAEQLLDRDRVLAVLGPIDSDAREALMPMHRSRRAPLLYATNYEGGACDRYLFVFDSVPNQALDPLVDELIGPAGRLFYLLGTQGPWAAKLFDRAQALAGALGARTAGSELVAFGEREFASSIRRIRESGAQVLLCALRGAAGEAFLAQAARAGLLDEIVVGLPGFALPHPDARANARRQPQVRAAAPIGAQPGIWATVPFTASIDEREVRDFVHRVQRIAGRDAPIPPSVATHYDALMALRAALGRAGAASREALVDALEGSSLETPTGTLTIGSDHHATLPMFLVRIEPEGASVVQRLGALAPAPGCTVSVR